MVKNHLLFGIHSQLQTVSEDLDSYYNGYDIDCYKHILIIGKLIEFIGDIKLNQTENINN